MAGAVLVRLRSPRGKVGVYHPDEYDIPKMLKAGFTRAGSVMVAAHERSHPLSVRQEQTFTPAEKSAAGITDQTPQRKEPWLVSQLPNAGGFAGDIFGRGVGGAIGLGAGAAVSAPSGGAAAPATVPAGVIAGQEIGGPIGAYLGGTSMEAARQLIDHAIGIDAPATIPEALGEANKAGLEQGAYSLIGSGLGHGVKAAARPVMGAALKWTPEVAQTAIREGITATRQGVNKLMVKLGEYGARTNRFIQQMTAQGVKYDPVDLVDRAGQLLKPEVDNIMTGERPEVLKAYAEEAQKFLSQWAPPGGAVKDMTPAQLQLAKQQFQQRAETIFAAMADKEKGHLVPRNQQIEAKFAKAMAEIIQQELEHRAPVMIDPKTGVAMTLGQANAQTADLIKLKDVLVPNTRNMREATAEIARRAAVPATGAVTGATIGALGNREHRFRGSAEGAIAGGLAASPAMLSNLALALAHPAVAATLRQVPRGVAVLASEPRKAKKK